MLSVQVEYWKLMENTRHNLATEQWNNASLDETTRHNIATENYNYDVLSENKRHNIATEAYNTAQLEEMKTHNRATEDISWYNAKTTREYEIPIKAVSAQAAASQAATAAKNATTNWFNAETNFANTKLKAAETQTTVFKNVASGTGSLLSGVWGTVAKAVAKTGVEIGKSLFKTSKH